jgi:MFS superfamily sulfate permease-like transporter
LYDEWSEQCDEWSEQCKVQKQHHLFEADDFRGFVDPELFAGIVQAIARIPQAIACIPQAIARIVQAIAGIASGRFGGTPFKSTR